MVIHPPIVAEFENGIFDTSVALPRLQAKIECCERHQKEIDTESKIVKALEGNLEFGTTYKKFHERTKAEELAEVEARAAELRAQIESEGGASQTGDDQNQNAGGDGANTGGVDYSSMSYNELKKEFSKRFPGVSPIGKSTVKLIEALSK